MKNAIKILGLALIFASCEKVIDVQLDDIEPIVVVEAVMNDVPKGSFVKLSYTGGVYETNNFESISGASITVTDELNNNYTFIEDPLNLGTYLDTTFVTVPNMTYSIVIVNDTNTYTASSHTNSDVVFDSLDYYYVSGGGFGGNPEDSVYFVFQNYSDPANEVNFYRVLPHVNGERDGSEYLNDDQLFNGNNFRQPLFATDLDKGDTLDLWLISMDEANYTYFYSLSAGQGSGPFSPTPGNPVSNIEGNAIGYFGAYMTYNEQIIFPE